MAHQRMPTSSGRRLPPKSFTHVVSSDRENTTVLVRHLPSSIDSERLESYFAEVSASPEISIDLL